LQNAKCKFKISNWGADGMRLPSNLHFAIFTLQFAIGWEGLLERWRHTCGTGLPPGVSAFTARKGGATGAGIEKCGWGEVKMQSAK
jgi:hypothetical protein